MDENIQDFYGDNHKIEREIVGYDGYTKDPLYEGDDIVEWKGKKYLRENFVQMNINGECESEKGIND